MQSLIASATNATGFAVGCTASSSSRPGSKRVHSRVCPNIVRERPWRPSSMLFTCGWSRSSTRKLVRAETDRTSPFRRWSCSIRRHSSAPKDAMVRRQESRPCGANPYRFGELNHRWYSRPTAGRSPSRISELFPAHLTGGHCKFTVANLAQPADVSSNLYVVGRVRKHEFCLFAVKQGVI